MARERTQVSVEEPEEVPESDLRKVLAALMSELDVDLYKGEFGGESTYEVRKKPRWD